MEGHDVCQVIIEISSLPDISKADMDFRDASFFQKGGESSSAVLPTPAEILEQNPGFVSGVLTFEALKLAVKVGDSSILRLEEAQAMIAIRRAFPCGEIPVPEVFGWRRRGDMIFLYMGLIPGQTLDKAWPSLDQAEREAICTALARIVRSQRRITQGAAKQFIGSINGGRIQDRYFQFDDEAGPLPTIKLFNDLALAAATHQNFDRDGTVAGPWRELLPDAGNIYFTHGDLTPKNIMISGPVGARRVEAIIDWEQAGWYPEYWEYCKMLYAVDYEHEWRTAGWVEKVITPCEDEWWAIAEYFHWRGHP